MAMTLEVLAERLKAAIESADLEAVSDLLAPDVRWGPPDDPVSGCQNRDEVRGWYKAAFDRGIRASVTEMIPSDHYLLVGLSVSGRDGSEGTRGGSERWQVLAIRDGLIADIRGYESRDEAAERAGITA